MSFVKDKKVIVRVNHKFTDSHTICCEGDLGTFGSLFFEPDIVANFLADVDLHLKSHSFSQCNRAYPSRLRYNDIFKVRVQILRHLGCLAATCLSTDEGNCILLDSLDDVILILQYW